MQRLALRPRRRRSGSRETAYSTGGPSTTRSPGATRGLLLDLLASGDVVAVNTAMNRFTALLLHARPELAAHVTPRCGASS